MQCISPQVLVSTREMPVNIGCVHTWGETPIDAIVSAVARVEVFVGAVALHVCE